MEHGTVNEINAIATLCSKILPVMYLSSSYFEEGCAVVFHNGKIMLLVSPDGSLRALSDSTCITEPHASFAIEIKCPFPGSIYKPKVHYEMPFYYVPQILCEMAVFEDLVGKQSNAFSRKTFSDEVEEEMRKLGYHSEAYFCHLIKEWYKAEDEPG